MSYAGRDTAGVPHYISRPFSSDERELLHRQFGIEDPSRLYLSDSTDTGHLNYDTEHDPGAGARRRLSGPVRETYRSPERQAYPMVLGRGLTFTATSMHSAGHGADLVVGDGDPRNSRTRARWIAFRRWVVAFEGGRFRLLGTPERSWDWPHVELAGGPLGFRSVESCRRPPGGKWRNYIGRMTFEEAGQHLSLALEAAVSRYGAMVRQVGRKHRLDDSDLDEVMQEVRIRLWRARGTSEMVGEANTSYIYRTASTAALDVLRRRRARQADRHDPIEEGPVAVLSAPTPDPHGVLEGSELAARVAQAIDSIAESRRPVVRMHLAGYPREEIASLMGWTEAKTRNLLYRGLADLRERLAQEGIGWDTTEA